MVVLHEQRISSFLDGSGLRVKADSRVVDLMDLDPRGWSVGSAIDVLLDSNGDELEVMRLPLEQAKHFWNEHQVDISDTVLLDSGAEVSYGTYETPDGNGFGYQVSNNQVTALVGLTPPSYTLNYLLDLLSGIGIESDADDNMIVNSASKRSSRRTPTVLQILPGLGLLDIQRRTAENARGLKSNPGATASGGSLYRSEGSGGEFLVLLSSNTLTNIIPAGEDKGNKRIIELAETLQVISD